VSLLAEARGHRPVPDVKTIGDLKSDAHVQALDAELRPLMQETLHHDDSERFQLDVYLGKHPGHQVLAEQLFARTRVPLLRVLFARAEGSWRIDALQAIGLEDVAMQDRAFLLDAVKSFIAKSSTSRRQGARSGRPRLAILRDPNEPHKPSNEQALQRFMKAAPLVGLEAELIGPDALERLPEFDALFNRAGPEIVIGEFLRAADSLGMPVVDDPESIVKCGNKVFMQELLNRHRIATPRTLIVHRGNVDEIVPTLGLPCVLKLPDSGFGFDVVKIESEDALHKEAERFFNQSELIIAQEWLPSDFDWRVGVYDRRPLFVAKYFMAPGHWQVNKVVEGQLIDGKTQAMTIPAIPNVAFERVLLVGLGPGGEFIESSYHTALCAATRTLRTTGAIDATLCLNELPVNGRDGAWKIEQAVLAVMDGLYRFDKLKSESPKQKRSLEKVVFHLAHSSEERAAEAAITRAAAIADGIALAKDLGNLPANICTPTYLAEQARALGSEHGFEVTILDQEDIEKLGMNAFLAVARGSRQPPKLIVMEYLGGVGDAQPVVLVGKGITFDTGGVDIKSASDMEEMKFDKCGAASVFGTLHATALMKLPLNVIGIVPAAENMPDGNAMKPGDVVTTMSGQTVEILDTDSEGRLALSDALTYAEKYEPAVLLDVATLTGAIVRAFGEIATGVFSNSDALVREVLEAGDRAWDRGWHMPLWREYQDTFKSNVADFANVGPHGDCAITAACFLSRFTKRYPWVHLDIAGTASKSGEDKGATGRPVALLAHFLAGRATG
jgi:leucyl aminopeptidase